MHILWQWHRVTAIGETDIIALAQANALESFAYHLAMVASGPQRITTLQEADDYFSRTETGSVSEVSQVELGGIVSLQPTDYDDVTDSWSRYAHHLNVTCQCGGKMVRPFPNRQDVAQWVCTDCAKKITFHMAPE